MSVYSEFFDPYDDESPQDKATREKEENEEAELEEAENHNKLRIQNNCDLGDFFFTRF